MRRNDLGMAYLFWIPSLTGIAGLHRFYLGKPLTGFLYLITVGLFGIGTIYDVLTMPQIVRRVRNRERLDRILDGEFPVPEESRYTPDRMSAWRFPGSGSGTARAARRPRSLEHAILLLAEERHGVVTPARVALLAEVSAEKARDALDRLVRQGFSDVRVSREGVMLYVFPEFVDREGWEELDSLT